MKNEDLIKTLQDCISKCNNCADACLDETNVQMMLECIRLDRVCAAVCQATAIALSTNSSAEFKGLVKACQEICGKCADECAKHEAEHCKGCAEACRKCAEACAAY